MNLTALTYMHVEEWVVLFKESAMRAIIGGSSRNKYVSNENR